MNHTPYTVQALQLMTASPLNVTVVIVVGMLQVCYAVKEL